MRIGKTLAKVDASAQRKRHILITNAVALLVAEASRGLFLGSMFGYLQVVSSENPTAILGWAVALFSVGRLIASFALGWWADAGTPYSTLLQATFFIQILGHVVYCLVHIFPLESSATPFLLSRLVVGFGSGTLGTCRAVVADITQPQERTSHLASLSLAKFIGYALMPGAGIFWTMDWSVMGIPINQFTAPAWVSIFLCLLGVLLVRNSFDPAFASAPRPISQAPKLAQRPTPSLAAGGGGDGAPLQTVALALFLALNLITKGVTAAAEAVLAPAFAGLYGPDGDDDLLQDTAEFSLALGVVGLACYALLVVKPPPPRPAPPAQCGAGPPLETGHPPRPASTAGPPAAKTVDSERGEEPLRLRGPADADAAPAAQARCGGTAEAGTEPSPAGGGPQASRGWVAGVRAWWVGRAERLDELLLAAGLLATAAGAAILAAAPASSGAGLLGGMLLLWSFGGPVTDVLCVSGFSLLLTRLGRPGQAKAMGYIAAAGSVGRIAFPASMGLLSVRGTMAFSAAVSAAATAAAVAFYQAYLPSRCPPQQQPPPSPQPPPQPPPPPPLADDAA